MNDDDARRININHCVRDSEIAEIEQMLADADPGDWRVNAVTNEIERYGGKPLSKVRESLRFAASSIRVVPRLLKGIRVLENAYQSARAEVAGLKNEYVREREDAKAAALRRSDGKTGPEWEPAQIARLAALWAALPEKDRFSDRNVGDAVAILFRRWLGGETVGEEVRRDIDTMQKRLDEHLRFKADWEAEQKATIERTRDTLAGWIAKLEAGEVPAEMAAQWARKTKEERKRFLAERREGEKRSA